MKRLSFLVLLVGLAVSAQAPTTFTASSACAGGQSCADVRLFDIFERGHRVLVLYGDEVRKLTGMTAFYYHGRLIATFRNDSGLIWKEVK